MTEIIHVEPKDIEAQSMATIDSELKQMGIVLNPLNEKIIKRAIHTTADFDYATTLKFSENAVKTALELIRGGAVIVTDTNMAYSGINKNELKKHGCEIYCFMSDEEVSEDAKRMNVTRASISMQKAASLYDNAIFVIGNAPTALISLREMFDKGEYRPKFIVGVPVGFVNVVASKEIIMETDIPYIINSGRKGGSNVAASIINALLYMLRDE